MVKFRADEEGNFWVTNPRPDDLETGERPIVICYQNESTFYSNDGVAQGYVQDEWLPIHSKGGQVLMSLSGLRL